MANIIEANCHLKNLIYEFNMLLNYFFLIKDIITICVSLPLYIGVDETDKAKNLVVTAMVEAEKSILREEKQAVGTETEPTEDQTEVDPHAPSPTNTI